MSEPLHVQVARALGWHDLEVDEKGCWRGIEPCGGRFVVPRYDTSWCSMGPIIERFEISIIKANPMDYPQAKNVDPWEAWWHVRDIQYEGHCPEDTTYGKTPCEAIAKMIVHLKKEGKLPND